MRHRVRRCCHPVDVLKAPNTLFICMKRRCCYLPFNQLQNHLNILKSLEFLETHQQILLAILDQLYHGKPENQFNSSKIWFNLQKEKGLLAPIENNNWQVNFTHLYGYGAVYYSYLFDRAIASKVWSTLFSKNPLSRESGEIFKSKLLKFGGGKDPWELLSNVLKDKRLFSNYYTNLSLLA